MIYNVFYIGRKISKNFGRPIRKASRKGIKHRVNSCGHRKNTASRKRQRKSKRR